MKSATSRRPPAPPAPLGNAEADPRWQSIVNRDARCDGRFVYAVKTTGVYCRPSCRSRLPKAENVGLFATPAEAEAAGFRACRRCGPIDAPFVAHDDAQAKLMPASAAVEAAEARMRNYDWDQVARDLDGHGAAVLTKLLSPAECDAIAALYPREEHFRSHVVMASHGFGKGEYRYFAYPLPDLVAGLRTALYPHLAPVANGWSERMGLGLRYPAEHRQFLELCHAAGQTRPTPLLLQYVAGDYNCLHQDLYGDLAFPLQVAILLSEPGKDFAGGEFVMTEQRPRMQSRAEVVPLRKGDAVVFAVRHRPVRGTRGAYRVNLRHGVSRVRAGERYTAGIIFHDAA
jgi:hypothetical protein